MKCPICGTQNKNGTTFCKICGTDLTNVVEPEPVVTGNPPGKSPLGIIIAISAAAVVLIAVVVLIVVLLNRDPGLGDVPAVATVVSTEASTEALTTEAATEPTTSNVVEVPNVVGMKSSDAYSTITRNGLKYNAEFAYDDHVPEDYIVSQTPKESKKSLLGDTISVVVSRGARPAITAAPAPESSQSSQQSSQVSAPSGGNTKDRYNLRASSRYLTRSDISFLDADGIQFAINELYAVHGYRFNQGSEKTYFESMSWYHPDTHDMNLVASRMNNYEKENLKVMAAYRDSLR